MTIFGKPCPPYWIMQIIDFISKHNKLMRYTLIHMCVKMHASTSFSLENICPHICVGPMLRHYCLLWGPKSAKIKSKKNYCGKTLWDIFKILSRGNITRQALSNSTGVNLWALPVWAALGGGRTELHTDIFQAKNELSWIKWKLLKISSKFFYAVT